MSGSGNEGRWFHRYDGPADARLRLVCFPHAGGSPSFYRSWQSLLAPGIELLAVCYPGHQDRFTEPFASSMDELVSRLTAALKPYLDRPVAFFGHSMGSTVAYESALRLQSPLTRLFVSGSVAPHRSEPTRLYLLDDQRFLDHVNELGSATVALYAQNGLRELLLPALRADYRLTETHQPSYDTPISAPIVVYQGEQDSGCEPGPMRAWGELTSARVEYRTFPGGHFYLEEHRDGLLRDISGRLVEDLRMLATARAIRRVP